MKSLRVLMVTTHFYPTVGGVERQASALARTLMAQGHSVAVVTHRPQGQASLELVDGIRVHRAIRACGRGLFYGASYLLSLSAFLLGQRRQYDLIHVHLLLLDAFAAGLLKRAVTKPVLAKAACGGAFGDVARLTRLRPRSLLRAGLWRLDRIVAPSRQVESELLAFGFPASRLVRIPNGVDSDRFRPAEDRGGVRRSLGLADRVVTFAGRLDPQKGLIPLFQAWERVAAKLSGVTLLLLGNGPQETELRRLADAMGLESHVVFCGEQADVLPYLQATDVFVLPSLAEGMSNALLEAMAVGVACVTSRIGGSTELIQDGQNGVLVEPGDPVQLADGLIRLLEDPYFAGHLGGEARQTVRERYSITRITRRYLELYMELLDRR